MSLNKGDFFSGLDTGLAYEVQDELGKGGFGITYRVEREDGTLKTKNLGTIGTRVFHAGRWIDLPAIGFPLGGRYRQIGFGFTSFPPGSVDSYGNQLIDSIDPYKMIEYFPANKQQ